MAAVITYPIKYTFLKRACWSGGPCTFLLGESLEERVTIPRIKGSSGRPAKLSPQNRENVLQVTITPQVRSGSEQVWV